LIEQKAMRAQLERQVAEKKQKNQELKTDFDSYADLERQQNEQSKRLQEETERQKIAKKKEVLEMQQRMIDARNKQIKQEKRAASEVDAKIREAVTQDIALQQELQANRIITQKQEMQRVKEDNERRRLMKQEQSERERQEELKLQRLTDQLAADVENQHAQELKAKSDKINLMMTAGRNLVNEQRLKNQEDESKRAEFNRRKERVLEMKEKKIKMKEEENKRKYKEILDVQIMERQLKLKAEREYIREQSDLWKQEAEHHEHFSKEKNEAWKTEVAQYKNLLEQQIAEKESKRAAERNSKFPSEDEIKMKMLEKIQNLEIQNRILDTQIKNDY
jgi:hypothetical protein